MEYVDMENWKRREHFAFFHSLDYPQFNICMNLDITRFLAFVQENSLSLYYSMIFAAATAANACENFRYRIRDGRVILHDMTHPSFTDITAGDDLFKIVSLNLSGSLLDFTEKAREAAKQKTSFLPDESEEMRDDLIYFTCLPWVSFTSISHTIKLRPDDCAPRISWGKYFKENGRILLPFSVQVNHALADGFHVGKYIQGLQEYLDAQ